MPGPLFNKIFRELWMNFGRSILVVLSIAIGVAAIGAVLGTQQTLARDLPANFASTNPASASLICDPFQDELVDIVRKVPGVTAAQGRYLLNVRLKTGQGTWQGIQLTVYPDYQKIQVNKIRPISGAWPPPNRQLLVERGSLSLAGAAVGDTVTLQMPDGKERQMMIAGLVHDLSQPAGIFSNQISGYITIDTLEWLGYAKAYNEVLITTQSTQQNGATDMRAVQATAGQVRNRIKANGKSVYWTTVQDPEQHWFTPYLTPMVSILGALSGLALLLSCFLVINTISALLAQQIRQIGMMKAIGGRNEQISGIFSGLILIYGLLALALAVPLGALGAQACIQVVSSLINFDSPIYQVNPAIITLQAILCLLIPLLAAVFPIHLGTRISVHSALNYTGVSAQAAYGSSLLDRMVSWIKILPNPVLLALRNTFRRKTRLILTLITLTAGSAIFIAVQNVGASLEQTLNQTLQYYNFDVAVFFDRPYRVEELKAVVEEIPAVKNVETWGLADAHRVRPDKSESDSIMFAAPPIGTQMVRPILEEGRWLIPQDQNAVVINTDLRRLEPDLKVGSTMVLKVNGKETTWEVVGVVKSVLMGSWAYTNQPYFAYALNQAGLASAVYITTSQSNDSQLKANIQQIENHLQEKMMHFNGISTVLDLRQGTILQFQVITDFLMLMALLIALVGGFGLMGMMSLNVLERSREIGIMRAIGARNNTIQGIVITEGLFSGILSWALGLGLSFPLGKLLGDVVGNAFLQASISNAFSPVGALIWLAVILVIATLASMAPAYQATRYVIREALAYE